MSAMQELLVIIVLNLVAGTWNKEMAGDEVDKNNDDLFSVGRQDGRSWTKRQMGNQGDDSDDLGLLSDIIDEVLEEEKKAKKTKNYSRHSRQVAVTRRRRQQQFQEGCKTSGYETRVREECGPATETVCETVQVTKTRKEMDQECTTKIEQKCLPTIKKVPHKKCTPRYERKCVTDYKTVEEKSYKEECHEDIQHVCEKLIEVPIAVQAPYPVKETDNLRSQQKQGQFNHLDNPSHPPPSYPRHYSNPLPYPHQHFATTQTPIYIHSSTLKSLPLDPVRAALVDNFNSHLERSKRESEPDAIPISKSQWSLLGSMHSKSVRDQILKAVNNVNVRSSQHIRSGNPSKSKILKTENAKEYVDLHPNTAFQLDAIYPQLKSKNSHTKDSFTFNRPSIFNNGTNLPSLQQINYDEDITISSSVEKSVNEQVKKSIQQAMFNVLNDEPSIQEALNIGLHEAPNMFDDTMHIVQDIPWANQQQTHVQANLRQSIKNTHWNSKQERSENLAILPRNVQDLHSVLQASTIKDAHHQEQKHLSGHKDHHPESRSTYTSHQYTDYQDSLVHPDSQEEHKPRITKVELAAPPGCRSFATIECRTVPTIVPKKAPFDKCHDVPAVDCFSVLKSVPDVLCSPQPYQDCTDVVKDVPYIGHEEQCQEVTYEECVEIEEQVPVQVCTQIDPSRQPIAQRQSSSYRRGLARSTPAVVK